MNEKVKAFLEAAQDDPGLRERLPKMSAEEIAAAAKEKGVELTEEDLKPSSDELSEGELKNVAGGGGCGCFGPGGGGGIDEDDGNVYGCACVVYGQGGDGRYNDFNCWCVAGGYGSDESQDLGHTRL